MTEEQIQRSLDSNRLELDNLGKVKHFGVVGLLVLVPVLVFLFHFIIQKTKGISGSFTDAELFIIVLFSILAYLLYKLQKNRLNFKIVETSLRRELLDKIIMQVASELKWKIVTKEQIIVEARTFPTAFSGSWGEQITILFDRNRVLVNSICDLKERPSIVSMGRNRRNTTKLINAIDQASTINSLKFT